MADFTDIVSDLWDFAGSAHYEEQRRHRLISAMIPHTVLDDEWADRYRMVEQTLDDLARLPVMADA